jgi:hypothetical protein
LADIEHLKDKVRANGKSYWNSNSIIDDRKPWD